MANTNTRKRNIARALLLAAALIWGSSFIVVKNTVETIPTHWLLFMRFSLAAVLLTLVMFKRLKKMDLATFKEGALLGVLLFIFYSVQTLGVSAPVLGAQATTAGKSAFLAAMYCVVTPFMVWLVNKKKPDRYNISAALLCIVGIGFVVLSGGEGGVLLGDVMILSTAVVTSLYLVLIARFTQRRDEMLITIVHFAVAAVLALIVALIFEDFPVGVPTASWVSVAYLAVLCSAVCMGFQNYGLKYAPANSAALLVSLEAPFGVVLAMLVGGSEEQLTPLLVVGFVLIFVAVIISETRLQFIPAFKEKGAIP